MRRLVTFPCEGEMLVGSLDEASGDTGLLVVSGGNEPRMGAHRGMALLAGRIAAMGWPVFRFDARGVGDSSGPNNGWASRAPDLAAAAAAFRAAAPGVGRLVGFGNCDAATALTLFGPEAGVDALVLANPWVVEREPGDLPPPAAIRARYLDGLRRPSKWARMLRGGVNILKFAKGLRAMLGKPPDAALTRKFTAALAGTPATIVLARGDATAIAYADAVQGLRIDAATVTIDTASHSFARSGDMDAVEAAIVAALTR